MAGERNYTTFNVDTDPNDADQNVDALLTGRKWDLSVTNVITFSFVDEASDFSYNPSSPFSSAFTAEQQAAAKLALANIAAVTGVVFDEIGDDPGENNAEGTLRYANHTGLSTAYGYYPSGSESAGDMAFKEGAYSSAPVGSYQYHTFLHETGHALGLKHGHETWGTGSLTDDKDGMEYSVMTYNSFIGQNESLGFYPNASGHFAQSLMMYDIAALQVMYGANWDTNSTDTVYTFSDTTGEMSINGIGQGAPVKNVIFRTIWDGGGTDTYDFSNYATGLNIDLAPASYVDLDTGGTSQRAMLNTGYDSSGSYVGAAAREYASGHVYNALQYEGSEASLIENAIGGTASDILSGNAASNKLEGRAGDDTISGLDGDDKLIGGGGGDVMTGDSGQDTLKGYAGDDTISGGDGGDLLVGGKGDDVYVGGGGSDKFRFSFKASGESDVITDFEDGLDMIRMNGGGSFDQLDIVQVGDDMVVSWDSNMITLTGMGTAEIGVDDFIF